MWSRDAFDVEVVSTSTQFVNLLVYSKHVPWLLTILYANPKDWVRELL